MSLLATIIIRCDGCGKSVIVEHMIAPNQLISTYAIVKRKAQSEGWFRIKKAHSTTQHYCPNCVGRLPDKARARETAKAIAGESREWK